jgi:hypothetical protein
VILSELGVNIALGQNGPTVRSSMFSHDGSRGMRVMTERLNELRASLAVGRRSVTSERTHQLSIHRQVRTLGRSPWDHEVAGPF